jgi:hypothetical protein
MLIQDGKRAGRAVRACRSAAVLLFTWIPSWAHAQGEALHLEPVPKAWFLGTVLSVPESNFNIETPGDGWTWGVGTHIELGKPELRNYVCQRQGGETRLLPLNPAARDTFILTVLSGEYRALRPQDIEALTQSVAGSRIQGLRYEPSDRPLPGGYHFTAQIQRSDGAKLFFSGYVAVAQKLYMFQSFSRDGTEPAAFTRLVASFHLLQPLPQPGLARVELPKAFFGFLCLIVLLVFLGIGGLVNRIAGRAVFNGGLVAFGLILLLLIIRVGYLASLSEPAGEEGHRVGYAVGGALIPLGLALWAWRRFSAKTVRGG